VSKRTKTSELARIGFWLALLILVVMAISTLDTGQEVLPVGKGGPASSDNDLQESYRQEEPLTYESAIDLVNLGFEAPIAGESVNGVQLDGTVQDVSGAFIESIPLRVIESDTGRHFDVISDADGRFSSTIAPLPCDRETVISVLGRGAAYGVLGAQFTVVAMGRVPLRAKLLCTSETCSVTGVMTYPNGQPISGGEVSSVGGGEEVRTAADGTFAIQAPIWNGLIRLNYGPGDDATSFICSAALRLVDLSSDEECELRDVRLVVPFVAKDFVLISTDDADLPIRDTRIYIGSSKRFQATSDDGSCILRLPLEPVTLRVTRTGFAAKLVDVDPSVSPDQLVVQLVRLVRVAGVVRFQGSSGSHMVMVDVSSHPNGGGDLGRLLCDSQNRFQFMAAKSGSTYWLTASALDGAKGSALYVSGISPEPVVIFLEGTGQIRGRVLGPTGAPLLGAAVSTTREDRSELEGATAVTDSDGWFAVPAAIEGTYSLCVAKRGYAITTVRATTGESINVQLAQQGYISGNVRCGRSAVSQQFSIRVLARNEHGERRVVYGPETFVGRTDFILELCTPPIGSQCQLAVVTEGCGEIIVDAVVCEAVDYAAAVEY
jgi:hypothetical protein